jgi:hypothetical protein
MKKKVSLMDVKTALLDSRFRDALPQELLTDVQKFLSNPGCGCNHPIYKRVMKVAGRQLADYYPTKEQTDPDELPEKVATESWEVINCAITELQGRLSKLDPARPKHLEIARWQDQVTVIVHYFDEDL